MRMGLRGIWVIIIVLTIFVGAITTGIVVFADEAPKTLAEECAEELEDDDMDLEGLFCLALQSLNAQFDGIFVQTDPNKPVLFLKVDPNSQAPALVVNDGTNDLFIVNNDGSIQIGSNTVVLNPDGTVTGGPLHLLVGSTVNNDLISTEPDEDTLGALLGAPLCMNKDLVQIKGSKWQCSKPADIVTAVGILPGSSGITEFVIELGPGMVTAKHPAFEVLQDFKITGLPSSTKGYTIPINLIRIEADMATDLASFEIILEESSGGTFSQFFFIGTVETTLGYRTQNNFVVNIDQIEIGKGETEKFFRLIGHTFDTKPTDPTGSFDNLKLVINLLIPKGATASLELL